MISTEPVAMVVGANLPVTVWLSSSSTRLLELTGSNTTKTLLSEASLAASTSYPATIGSSGTITLAKYTKAIALSASGTFDASATGGLEVLVDASPDGSTFDDANNPFAQFTVAVNAGNEGQKTLLDRASGVVAVLAFQLKNLDGTYAITDPLLTYMEED